MRNGHSETIQIDPKTARGLLKSSVNNRRISIGRVKQYAARMARGEWATSEVSIDEKGAFCDGHHRMYAVIMSNTTQQFLVRRGVPRSELYLIDDVKPRSLVDQLAMFTRTKNTTKTASSMKVCASLLMAHARIGNLEEYGLWRRIFGVGIDWSVTHYVSVNNFLNRAPVIGGTAFMYDVDPKRIQKFATLLRDGEGLQKGSPVYALRAWLEASHAIGVGNKNRLEVIQKTLSAGYAYLHGQTAVKMYSSSEAVRFFVQHYSEQPKVQRILAAAMPYGDGQVTDGSLKDQLSSLLAE